MKAGSLSVSQVRSSRDQHLFGLSSCWKGFWVLSPGLALREGFVGGGGERERERESFRGLAPCCVARGGRDVYL